MSWFESASHQPQPSPPSALNAQQAALVQLGALSPLWFMFLSASSIGMAYWTATRWMTLGAPQRPMATVVKLRLVQPAPLREPEAPLQAVSPAARAGVPAAAPGPARVSAPPEPAPESMPPESIANAPQAASPAADSVAVALAKPAKAPRAPKRVLSVSEAAVGLATPAAPKARKPRKPA